MALHAAHGHLGSAGRRTPPGAGACAPSLRQNHVRRLPAPAKSQPPGWHGASRSAVAAGAWADAALVLIELELPAWSLRRLIREEANGSARCRGSPICPRRSTSLRMRITIACRSPSCWRFCKRGARRKLRRRPFRRPRMCSRGRTASSAATISLEPMATAQRSCGILI